jgi:hypothetical protein
MHHYEEFTKTIADHKLIKVTCDRCGVEMPEPSDTYKTRHFRIKAIKKTIVEFEYTTGTLYPGSGHDEGWAVEDLCDECVEWLKQVLIDGGVKLGEVNRSW